MSDLLDTLPQATKRNRPEAFLQTQLKKWCRESITERHKFLAYDRSEGKGKQHLWESIRGVTKGTLDTELLVGSGRALRLPPFKIELKVPPNKVKPGDAQDVMIADLTELGCIAGWLTSITAYCDLLLSHGVQLAPLARHRAEALDRLLEGEKPVRAKRSPRKSAPRFEASKGFRERARKVGVQV